jgi:hypothetical protein
MGSNYLPQDSDILIMDVPAVAAKVDSDAVGSGELAYHGCSDGVWLKRFARLSNSCDVVDIYV